MQKVITEGHHLHKALHSKLDFQANKSVYTDLHSRFIEKVQSNDMAELTIKVSKWRKQRLESKRNLSVNERGGGLDRVGGDIDIEDEHKRIIEEASMLDKLSDCSAEVP